MFQAILSSVHQFWVYPFCCSLVTKLYLALLQPHGLYSPPHSSVHGIFQEDTEVGCRFLLQGISQIQGLNPCLLHWQVGSLPLSHQRSIYPFYMPSKPGFRSSHGN